MLCVKASKKPCMCVCVCVCVCVKVCGADNETHAMQISGFPGQLVRDRMNVERLDTVLDVSNSTEST